MSCFPIVVAAPVGRFVLDVALAPARVRLQSGQQVIFDGLMAPGASYLCRPAHTLRAEFSGPADFVRLYVAANGVDGSTAWSSPSADHSPGTPFARDDLIDQLARALCTMDERTSAAYIEALAKAMLARALQIRPIRSRVSPLPSWRLRRVVEHIEAHVSETILLADLAATAGLSRTHFTAQFRLATGCRPHDFILQRRIEAAKRLLLETAAELVDIAFSVGFQTQAHFSTVFKRLVGESPGRWRRQHRVEDRDGETLSVTVWPVAAPSPSADLLAFPDERRA